MIKSKDEELRFKKLMLRDNVTQEYVKLRDRASIEYNESEFDFVFDNNYNDVELQKNVAIVVNFIKSGKRKAKG
ncbi:MAG: hypothetical protein SPK63_00815 [Eubacteriales bacterium]|nr:hypothetical protein [Eubacteriales bacterium]